MKTFFFGMKTPLFCIFQCCIRYCNIFWHEWYLAWFGSYLGRKSLQYLIEMCPWLERTWMYMGMLLASLKVGQLSGRPAKIALGKIKSADESLIILCKDVPVILYLHKAACAKSSSNASSQSVFSFAFYLVIIYTSSDHLPVPMEHHGQQLLCQLCWHDWQALHN